MLAFVVFFFKDPATTEIYAYGHTLSLHDALPICGALSISLHRGIWCALASRRLAVISLRRSRGLRKRIWSSLNVVWTACELLSWPSRYASSFRMATSKRQTQHVQQDNQALLRCR